MLLKFIGTYTGGRESISYPPYDFHGHEPTNVDARTAVGKRLANNPDFAAVEPKEKPPAEPKPAKPARAPKK